MSEPSEETMFAVFAAEQQYRHDTRVRERERTLLAAIRERKTAVEHRTTVVSAAARTQRAAWPRPIGLRAAEQCVTACAVA
jgi:hypothetical protein